MLKLVILHILKYPTKYNFYLLDHFLTKASHVSLTMADLINAYSQVGDPLVNKLGFLLHAIVQLKLGRLIVMSKE